MSRNILVVAETRDGQLRNVSLEALSVARKIADGGEVSAVLVGRNENSHADKLARYGADKIYVLENDQLDQYTSSAYTQAFVQMVEQLNPDSIVLGHTAIGRDFAPRVAARLGLGLVSDCVDVSVNGDELVFTRPIYSGKAFAQKRIAEGKIFVTIRPNNFSTSEPNVSQIPTVIPFDVEIKDLRTLVKEVVRKTTGTVDLTEAKIIISGGRGVKSADGFRPLKELAEVLGGAVGASRGACDQSYCDYSMQIGQTGKVVTPDVYIACGISGAIQHLAGMSNSKIIVAINKDPEAPIFKVADYGIVGDLFEVVPLLTEEFKKVFMVTK
ncbi:electron transfer flavoprotein subunit alpha/FixB family protein [Ammoniphilus sp. 3BR4]|uniref:electron transfer flavoprotein subunit alpha/FixB family protein n=1 Tax=Ammoniphilus sp. 3BR4 TaxID=3158265 RepID=UPI003465054F